MSGTKQQLNLHNEPRRMTMSKNEVAAKKTTAVAIAMSFEDDAVAGGFENMGQEDFALPFLRLLTNTSPEVGEVEGAMPGMIYNTVTGQLYDGKKGITVIPCAYVRQYIEWAPRGSGSGAPIAIYPATSDILSRTHKEPGDNKDYLDNGNYIENTANHYVMVLNEENVPEPALITMKSTQLKKSRKWNSMMMSVKLMGAAGMYTPPMFSQLYRLSTQAESNDKGKWFGWEIERIGPIEDADVYLSAKTFASSISSGDVKVKHQHDDIGTGDAAPF
jgi:hypothetical protein